ncbi:collagen alpha-1(I) chain-like [Myotis daubentonii]|uniref:collagen alpha-1(I) chain-like n=1 Tax=Myotis daubentonii TaxID=98922 RepID=UPI0028736776|nr:collagen alpha-1(I) chain-like [Myotis daubentonii]
MAAGVEERSAPRIARALPARGVCSPRTAGRGSWLLGARPAPPGQAPGSGRPERRRPWSRHGAPSSANRHRAACRARGRGGAAGLAACPGVPVRAAEPRAAGTYLGGGVSSGDPPAASWREAEESSPAQRPAASSCSCCRGQTTPSGPAGTFTACRELRGPRRESGRARQPPTSLPHSLGSGKRRSASPKPSITPIGPTSALPSLTHAGGDGQDATAISARGEGRSSSAGPTAAPGRGETPPPAARLLSPPPFPPGLMDEHRPRLEPAFPFGPRREGEKKHAEQPGRCAPSPACCLKMRAAVGRPWDPASGSLTAESALPSGPPAREISQYHKGARSAQLVADAVLRLARCKPACLRHMCRELPCKVDEGSNQSTALIPLFTPRFSFKRCA